MFCGAPLHLHYISTTCFGMLHYMARNDYRRDKKQVSFVVDEGLWAAVKGCAVARGWSVTRFVTEVLEREVGDGDFGVGPGGGARFAAGGFGAGEERGRGGVVDPVEPAVGRVDWDRVLAQGISRKAAAPWSVAEAVADSAVNPYRLDPIEEIA